MSGVNNFTISVLKPGFVTKVNALQLFEKVEGQNNGDPVERIRVSNIVYSTGGEDTNPQEVNSTNGMFRVEETFKDTPVESFDIELLDDTGRPVTIEVVVRGCIEIGEQFALSMICIL